MPIAESPAEMAQAMMTRIREMHREGKSREEILAYFVDRYGEGVGLEPKAEGLNWLVWVLPPLVLLGCLLGLLRFIRRERAEAEALPDEAPAEIENEYLKTIRQDVLH